MRLLAIYRVRHIAERRRIGRPLLPHERDQGTSFRLPHRVAPRLFRSRRHPSHHDANRPSARFGIPGRCEELSSKTRSCLGRYRNSRSDKECCRQGHLLSREIKPDDLRPTASIHFPLCPYLESPVVGENENFGRIGERFTTSRLATREPFTI